MPPITLARIAQALDQSSEQIRIKKLLICTCYGTWETRRESLDRMGMADLVETVLMRSPTLDSLQHELNRVVKTLSKPVEYAHIANLIVQAMTWLYQQPAPAAAPPKPAAAPPAPWTAPKPTEDDEQTGWLGAPAHIPPPNPYQEALKQLKAHPQGTRLKKLAICACYNTWESDPATLEATSWEKLLPHILDLIPRRQNLDYVMQQIVNSLSKPQTYRAIAQALIQILLPLYEEASPPPTFRDIPPTPPRPNPSVAPSPRPPVAPAVPPAPVPPAPVPPAPVPPPLPRVDPTEAVTLVSTTPIAHPAAPAATMPPPAPAIDPTEEVTVVSTTPIAHPARPQPSYGTEEATIFSTTPIAHPARPQPSYGTEEATIFSTTPIAHPATPPAAYPALDSTDITLPDPQAYSVYTYDDLAEPLPIDPPVPHPPLAAGTINPAPAYDPFDLRIELMKYTNPLMVKILIYSLLYEPFDFRTSDWRQLREFDLDSLIQTLYGQFQHYAELGTCLQSMAEQLAEPDLALQAAGTLLRVLKPMYLQRP